LKLLGKEFYFAYLHLIFSENSKIVNKSNKINSILKIKNAQIIEMDTENV